MGSGGGIGMRRTIAAAAVLLGALAVAGIPAAALAGGGCHEGATQQDATGDDEAAVRMVGACFNASVTTVDPGTDVTFVNEDAGTTHNVAGMQWGNFEDMSEGDTYTATFDEPGIFPFACSYHPGMTGAIVVGDGTGAGNGLSVSTTPPDLGPVDTSATPVASTASTTPWVALAAIGGVAIGAAATIAVRRTSKTPAA
jgi:plastocyanin